jgi:hypothetical protein
MGERRKAYGALGRRLEGNRPLGKPRIGGRIISK